MFFEFVSREARVKVEKGLGCREGCTANVDADALCFEIIFFPPSAKSGLVKVKD